MQKFRLLALLMGITILGITGFQLYWLKNNYEREKKTLELQTNTSFRQTILKLQASKMKLGMIRLESDHSFPVPPPGIRVRRGNDRPFDERPDAGRKEPPITMINLLQEKMKEFAGDTSEKEAFDIATRIARDSLKTMRGRQINSAISSITITTTNDSLLAVSPGQVREVTINNRKKEGKPAIGTNIPGRDAVFRFLYNVDSTSAKDSVTIKEITHAYAARLKEDKMGLSFAIARLDSNSVDSAAFDEVTLGFANPVTYKLLLKNKMSYILEKLTMPILFSVLLVGITIASFVLLYRSLLKQRKLAELKNQFISNITHELKTPIATVGVAIEALKNFNAMHDPQRTQEYLDISQNELHRLSLLVDKVLKLSMFEKKEIELKKEQFDCRQLVEEVMNSMKLQFDKYHAKARLHTEGDNFIIDADKLHITSVIYNLLDNALKYSRENPVIDVTLSSRPEYIEFSVSDNGIGIEPAYRQKIFDKFFRVPTGDKHNIKGYGLGLSYVAEVIKRHHGQVYVESEPGKGSTFIAKVPFSATA